MRHLFLVVLVLAACGNGIDATVHTDGFGHGWDDELGSGTYTTAEAQKACVRYRQALAEGFAAPDAGVEDQTPDVALNFLCQPVQDSEGTVTKVCTLVELHEAPSLDIIGRKTCWHLDGTITVNDVTIPNHWH